MKLKSLATILITAASILLTGCTNQFGGDESSAADLWLGIEPALENEFGKETYEDGLYLSQTVKEPQPNPYAKDKKRVREGTTDDGIRYVLYQEHAEIIGHSAKFNAEELVIPETISDKPVTKIVSVEFSDTNRFEADKSGAFYSCYTLSKVTLPDGLYEIGDYAFYGCKNLRTIEIPESVMHIGKSAFAMCSNLSSLTVPSGIDTIGDNAFLQTPWYNDLLLHRDLIIFNGRLYDAGNRCTGEVIVPDHVVSISNYAFYSCADITAVILPESVQSIGQCAFRDCPMLRDVVIRNPDCKIYSDMSTFSNKKKIGDLDYFRGTIYGEKDSKVEKFAKKFGHDFEETSEYSPKSDKKK